MAVDIITTSVIWIVSNLMIPLFASIYKIGAYLGGSSYGVLGAFIASIILAGILIMKVFVVKGPIPNLLFSGFLQGAILTIILFTLMMVAAQVNAGFNIPINMTGVIK